MPAPTRLSAAEARRIALAAQGFTGRRPAGRVDRRHLARVVGQVGMFQIDSVNIVARAHYVPLYSRLGPYDRGLLDRAAYEHGTLFEYEGHAAALLPVEVHPLLRWRMDEMHARWVSRVSAERAEYVERVYAEVVERGPLAASELEDPGERSGPWWGWNAGKSALEWLYLTGRVAAVRRPSFERVYDLPERIIPADVLARPAVPKADARRALLVLAARSLGVATLTDLADYHRQKVPQVRPLVAELVEEGVLLPVAVDGWKRPGFLHRDAAVPRRVEARALVSPFDSLVWERPRVARLFGFELLLEIYVPAPKRRWGYYVFPFLLGDALVARVDLKADRRERTLRVLAAYAEPARDPKAVAGPLAAELGLMAEWLDLDRVSVNDRGDLASALRRAAGSRRAD